MLFSPSPASSPLAGLPDPAWTLAIVDDQRRRRRRLERLGRRPLSPALWLLLWGLRVYVLFMMGVVAQVLWQNWH